MRDDPQASIPSVDAVDEVLGGVSEELQSLGITAHEHITYEWSGYRYSNAKDAIAAARRALR